MAKLPELSGPSRSPRSGKAKQLVVLLHGWGADGPNLIDLADLFGQVLPDAHFIAPNAPYVCEANPYGYQWFSLMDRQPQHMLEGVRGAAEILNHFLDGQLEALVSSPRRGEVGRGASAEEQKLSASQASPHPNPPPAGEGIKLALVGFSQGTMLALHVALRRTPPVACVAGFSGALLSPDMLSKEISARPPVCLIHGEADDVVPFASLERAVTALKAHGVPVASHARPFLGHSIDMEGIRVAAEFLGKHLA